MTRAEVRRDSVARLIFGSSGACLKLTASGLVISEHERDRVVPISHLTAPPRVTHGWLWGRIEISTSSGTCTFRGFPKSALDFLAHTLNGCLKQLTQDRLNLECAPLWRAADEVDRLLESSEYVRDSHRIRVVESVRPSLSITHNALWEAYASPSRRELAARVSEFVRASEGLVEQANASFVESELTRFGTFFDSVERSPLTDAQRRACVINEDNNLVLAGAGTGKTSVMTGRAGYLIASGRARPVEILMLAYARKASEEMQERQRSRLGPLVSEGPPAVKTFHAIGLEIIGAAEGQRPDITPMAEDKHAFARFIDERIDAHCQDEAYRRDLLHYCGSERYPYRNLFDFESMAAYDEYVRENELRTLNGEVVKSFEECVIANFLNSHSIRYEYETPYEVHTATPDFKQYRPDFFLPDAGAYIEHFALGRDGMPPAHFDQDKYLRGIEWKRRLHQEHGTTLIETYSYLKREGTLESSLADALRDAGVELVRRPDDELLDQLRELGEVAEFAELLSDFIARFKESDRTLDEVQEMAAEHKDCQRLLLLLDLMTPIYEDYEAHLAAHRQIDFADMIRRAIDHVESRRYSSRWTHILVDEFQDISRPRARLLKALLRQRPDSILFAVGDDWQAIYRFTGSDIEFTRSFPGKFGATATTELETTFRFNNQLADVASHFVLKNPAQTPKTIMSATDIPEPAVSLVRALRVEDGLHLALEAIQDRSEYGQTERASVLVLGRYNFTIDELRGPAVKRELKTRFPSLDVEFMTVHSAKGREADYVVVLGLEKGKHGFPSRKPTDAVLEFLLPPLEHYRHAEERRLFYVAMTRARRRVYLVYNPMNASPFVRELIADSEQHPVRVDEFDDALICAEIPLVPCPTCKVGALVPRTGPHGAFVGCDNFPYCRHREKACPQCGGLMRRAGRCRTCVSERCGAVVPTCPRCGGDLVERQGPHGRFWGCMNYRRGVDSPCTHTEPIDKRRPTRFGSRR